MPHRTTELKFLSVIPQPLILDGGVYGQISILNASTLFKVGQKIFLKSTTQPPFPVKINRFLSESEFVVGRIDKLGSNRVDVSMYLVADTAIVDAVEQPRPALNSEHILSYVYSEEPTIALRTTLVDSSGDLFNTQNPLPVQLSNGSVNIGTVNAELEVQLSRQDNSPDLGDIHDAVRVGNQTVEWDFLALGGNVGAGVTRTVETNNVTTITSTVDNVTGIIINPVTNPTFLIVKPQNSGRFFWSFDTSTLPIQANANRFDRIAFIVFNNLNAPIRIAKSNGSGVVTINQGNII